MRKDFNARYRLIIERIRQSPCNYEQIAGYLLKSNEFQRIGMNNYSVRTLQRDIQEINSLNDFHIHNKRKDNRYFIKENLE